MRWKTIAISFFLLLIFASILFTIQRQWAEAQSPVGYIPEVGFVDLGATRVLAASVSETRDQITIHVRQVVALPERTVIVLWAENLPAVDVLDASGKPNFNTEIAETLLYIPNGRSMTPETESIGVDWTTGIGQATLEFPPLPLDVSRLTLEVSERLWEGLQEGEPDIWVFPLLLQPVTDVARDEVLAGVYELTDSSDTHQGITLRVLSAAYRPEVTALRVHLQWPEPQWNFSASPFLGAKQLELSGDTGGVYEKMIYAGNEWFSLAEVIKTTRPQANIGSPSPVKAIEQTLTFAPVVSEEKQLTLTVDEIKFDVPLDDIAFGFDLGENPRIGDAWPMDVWLDVAGFQVHITGARIVESLPGFESPGVLFVVEPVSAKDGFALESLSINGSDSGFSGSYFDVVESGGFLASLHVVKGASFPTGWIQVRVESAVVSAKGPWQVSWTLPGSN